MHLKPGLLKWSERHLTFEASGTRCIFVTGILFYIDSEKKKNQPVNFKLRKTQTDLWISVVEKG